MKKLISMGIIFILLTPNLFAEVGFKGRPITNNLMMPTGYTLNRGEFIVGIGPVGFGITDNVQVGTNILLFLFQVYNVNLKVNFVKTESQAFAVGLDLNNFNLDVFEEETGFTSVSPYASFSTRVGTNTLLHLGGSYSVFTSDKDIEDAKVESSSSGTSLYTGLEYSFSHKTKFLAEGGYDITFEGFRVGGGVLFGWTKFRLKLGVNYFKPKDVSVFTFPVIGLWWRFEG
jgi:hypothetical protein